MKTDASTIEDHYSSPVANVRQWFTEDHLSLIYAELKRIAQGFLRGESEGHTLQPTALLHEALLRFREVDDRANLSDQEFCAAAAGIMRRVLVDHARHKKAQKRGGRFVRLDLDQANLPASSLPIVDLLDLDAALNELTELNRRHADVIQMRYFAGFTVPETAAILGVSAATVKNDWRVARAWLLSRLRTQDAQ